MADSNEPAAAGDTLSQSEVERLLAQVTTQENSVTVLKSGEKSELKSKESIQPYDFRHPVFLSAGELRRLRIQHEDFIRSLAARLSIYLRLEFSLQMSKLQTLPYAKFTQGLANPTHLSLFKIEPLRGIGILEIQPRLGLAIVDRLLGGTSQSVAADHEFSEIEVALLAQVIQLILGEWCNHWVNVQELRAVSLGHENSGQFLQTAPHDTVLLVLGLEAKIGDCVDSMQIALPCLTLEPLIRKLGEKTEAETQKTGLPTAPPKWNRNFDEIPVAVAAIWEDLVLTVRELAALKEGDVLPLNPKCARQVKLRLANLPKFEGHLGTIGGKWAVSVTQMLTSES